MWRNTTFWKTSLVMGTGLFLGLPIIDYNFIKSLSTETLSVLLGIGITLMLLTIPVVMPSEEEETQGTHS